MCIEALFENLPSELQRKCMNLVGYVFNDGELHFVTPGFIIKDRKFFKQFKGLKRITGFPILVGDMSYAFRHQWELKSAELETKNVTDMRFMFQNCPVLELVTMTIGYLSLVCGMFNQCELLNLDALETNGILISESMFKDSFLSVMLNTENVTDMWYMFEGCSRSIE
jgi:hypothetical protein